MAHPLRFGLKASGQWITIDQLRTIWKIADEGGFDHLWDFDHLASIGPAGPDGPIYEGWAMLAAMAEATRRVRIGCLVTGNTYRHPVVLAKLAVTVDHLSGGRLEFGIGAAWNEVEHEMYGIDGLYHRVGRLSESLQVLKSLFTQEKTTFDGRYERSGKKTAGTLRREYQLETNDAVADKEFTLSAFSLPELRLRCNGLVHMTRQVVRQARYGRG